MELGPEIEVMAGYALRLSRVTVKPGAFFAPHSHKNQPEIIYVVEGSLTEQRNLEPEREHGPGSVLILTKEITHSLANNTSSPVVYISTSVKA